jgi:DNA-binding NarL/FixJ family response regulator
MTKKIRTLLVDDSFQARELLRFMLIDLAPSIEVVGEAENVDSAIQLIRDLKVDLVFLDIEMPEKSGNVGTEDVFVFIESKISRYKWTNPWIFCQRNHWF